jgi:hypothetical protein
MGRYHAEHFRAGRLIDEWDFDNIAVNEGLNYLLNAGLAAGSQITTWYLGLFSGNYTPVATDAAATIAANSTETSAYTAGARQQFVPVSASGQQVTNSASRASFTFNAGTTIYGAFLVSSSTINGTTGTLISAAQFGSAKSVSNTDQILLTYTFSLASA